MQSHKTQLIKINPRFLPKQNYTYYKYLKSLLLINFLRENILIIQNML